MVTISVWMIQVYFFCNSGNISTKGVSCFSGVSPNTHSFWAAVRRSDIVDRLTWSASIDISFISILQFILPLTSTISHSRKT